MSEASMFKFGGLTAEELAEGWRARKNSEGCQTLAEKMDVLPDGSRAKDYASIAYAASLLALDGEAELAFSLAMRREQLQQGVAE